MNQIERELFFMAEESPLKKLTAAERMFPPHGNHKRSLIGKRWYYLAESEQSYDLFYDEVVQEDATGIWLKLYMNDKELTPNTLYVSREQYKKMYPVQELFPVPVNNRDALLILRDYFRGQQTNQERSTTIESQGE